MSTCTLRVTLRHIRPAFSDLASLSSLSSSGLVILQRVEGIDPPAISVACQTKKPRCNSSLSALWCLISKMVWVFLFPFYHLLCHLVELYALNCVCSVCTKYFNFLIWLVVKRRFCSFILDQTSLFVTFSVHDISSILLLKRHGDSPHPCLTPLLVRISFERLFLIRIDALLFWCVSVSDAK